MENYEETSFEDLYIKFVEAKEYLIKRFVKILAVAIFGSAMGFTYSILQPNNYTAKLDFIVEGANNSSNLGSLSGIARSFGIGGGLGGGGGNGLYDNQTNLINLIKSRSIIENSYLTRIPGKNTTFAQEFLRLNDWVDDCNSLFNGNYFFDNGKRNNLYLTPKEDSLLLKIHNLTVEELLDIYIPDNSGSIMSIEYESIDDSFALYFPEVLLMKVSTKYIWAKTNQAKENVNILSKQVDSVKLILKNSILNAAIETDKTFALNPAKNITRTGLAEEQFNLESSKILLAELIKNQELAKIQLKDQTPLIEIIDKPKLPLVQKEQKGVLFSMVSFSFLFAFLFILFLLVRRFLNKIKMNTLNLKKNE